ncbi:hypothetical protein K7432_002266 [Basidiobolus ranarum]|uniref:DUF4436 domain-containing protein n=1 Tax=Basidiobolus ranarum TaxID=34480 RepID=A0ABR2W8D3_9FUNG
MMRSLRGILPNFYFRRLFYAGITAIFLCSFVLPVFIIYLQKGPKYINTQYGSTLETRLDMMITVVTVDSISLRSTLSVDFNPMGSLITDGKLKLNDTVSVNFLYKSFTFPQNSSSILPSGEISVPFYEGTRRNYPFDVYKGDVLLYAAIPKVGDDLVVPISVSFTANVQNFEISPVFSVQDEFNMITFTARRSNNTKVFSICVIILMWALSLGISSLAFQIVMLKREIQPPIMALGVSMLFSLPALRNIQPGIPSIGCGADMIGFFWNMFLVAISAIGFIWTYSATWSRPPRVVDAPTPASTDSCQTSTIQKIN